MKLLKTFANTTHKTAAIHSVGGGYIVRCYDRSQRNGLIRTTSAPDFDRACALGAAFVYDLKS
jgi:hypothetical protein